MQLSLFRDEFNKLNKTRARMLDPTLNRSYKLWKRIGTPPNIFITTQFYDVKQDKIMIHCHNFVVILR